MSSTMRTRKQQESDDDDMEEGCGHDKFLLKRLRKKRGYAYVDSESDIESDSESDSEIESGGYEGKESVFPITFVISVDKDGDEKHTSKDECQQAETTEEYEDGELPPTLLDSEKADEKGHDKSDEQDHCNKENNVKHHCHPRRKRQKVYESRSTKVDARRNSDRHRSLFSKRKERVDIRKKFSHHRPRGWQNAKGYRYRPKGRRSGWDQKYSPAHHSVKNNCSRVLKPATRLSTTTVSGKRVHCETIFPKSETSTRPHADRIDDKKTEKKKHQRSRRTRETKEDPVQRLNKKSQSEKTTVFRKSSDKEPGDKPIKVLKKDGVTSGSDSSQKTDLIPTKNLLVMDTITKTFLKKKRFILHKRGEK